MAVDKDRAVHGGWRISEKRIWVVGLIGGWWGLLLGVYLLHHKASKPLFMMVTLGIAALWLYFLDHLVPFLGPPLLPGPQ